MESSSAVSQKSQAYLELEQPMERAMLRRTSPRNSWAPSQSRFHGGRWSPCPPTDPEPYHGASKVVLRQAKIHHTLWAAELWFPGRQLRQACCSGAGGEGGREMSRPTTPGGHCGALREQQIQNLEKARTQRKPGLPNCFDLRGICQSKREPRNCA